jgi:hypothetical protein
LSFWPWTKFGYFRPPNTKPTIQQMAQNSASNKGPFLWLIGPVAVALTLMFTSINHATVQPQEQLSGEHPATQKVEAPKHEAHNEHSTAGDTLHHEAAADTTHHDAVVHEEAPKHEEGAHH